MADSMVVQVPALSRVTAEFVRRVFTKICLKSPLKILASEGTSAPPLEYLSSIRLGRWLTFSEYPSLNGEEIGFLSLTAGGDGFPSGLRFKVREMGHFFLSFHPDHLLAEEGTGQAHLGYGLIDLTVVQQYIEEGNSDMLKMYASMIRAAIVEAIRADERGMEKYRRPTFTCPAIDPE